MAECASHVTCEPAFALDLLDRDARREIEPMVLKVELQPGGVRHLRAALKPEISRYDVKPNFDHWDFSLADHDRVVDQLIIMAAVLPRLRPDSPEVRSVANRLVCRF
jgi:hypothetical protein